MNEIFSNIMWNRGEERRGSPCHRVLDRLLQRVGSIAATPLCLN